MMYQMKFHPKNPYYVIANAPHQVWMVSKDAESPIVLKYESWTSNNDMKKELYTLYYKGERFKLPLGIPNLSFLKELLIREPRPEPQQQPQAIIAH